MDENRKVVTCIHNCPGSHSGRLEGGSTRKWCAGLTQSPPMTITKAEERSIFSRTAAPPCLPPCLIPASPDVILDQSTESILSGFPKDRQALVVNVVEELPLTADHTTGCSIARCLRLTKTTRTMIVILQNKYKWKKNVTSLDM